MQTPERSSRKGQTKLSLLKTHARKSADVQPSKTARNEGQQYKQIADVLQDAVGGAVSVIVTTLPRGSLQIAQPAKVSESLLKGYQRELHLEDRLTWQAIMTGKPVTSADVFDDNARYVRELMTPLGFAHAAAAPLESPVLEFYPGAVHAYRTAEEGPFSAEQLRKLSAAAKEIDDIVEKSRVARRGGPAERSLSLTPRPDARIFAYNEKGEQLLASDEYEKLDGRLRELMVDQAKARMNKLNGQLVYADRLQLPDSRGDLWTFRVIVYTRYPAIGEDGPIAIFCLQPSAAEWAVVRPTDLQADVELARLVPALKFMRQEFHRGPTLGEISKQVHLSPFHFHRRFAELLGLTPKHYLLECQIQEAKSQLLARRKELAQIATDCGFAHQSHFTSRFKQATGLTPTRWRRLAVQTHG